MSGHGEKRLISCKSCGAEFVGDPRACYCKDCRRKRAQAGLQAKEPPTVKCGWRHMYRNATGTAIRGGGDVIKALDDLCAYEEACEAAGIHGPEALKQVLEGLKQENGAHCAPLQLRADAGGGPCGGDGGQETDDAAPRAKRPRWTSGQHCEGCASYQPTVPSGGHGICRIHKRRVRPQGGKGQKYIILDEPRPVQARRVACGDWVDKKRAPEWVGPSAELLRKET